MTIPNSVKTRPASKAGEHELQAGGARLAVRFLAPDLVRVRIIVGRKNAAAGSGVPRSDWPAVELRDLSANGSRVLASSSAVLAARQSDGRLELRRGNDVALVGADERWLRGSDKGIELSFSLKPTDRLFGFGEKTGPPDRRGRRLEMWASDERPDTIRSDPLYQAIPFGLLFRDGRALGVFVDHPGRSVFDLGARDPDVWTIAVDAPVVELYFFTGPDARQVLDRFTELTGRPFVPPRWALGYQQSRWGYDSATRLLEVAREFRRRKIGCDALYLDIDYMDGFRVFTWDRTRFPDPAGLVRELARDGFRLITIVDPGVKVDPHDATYRQGLRDRHFCRKDGRPYVGKVWPGAVVFPDFQRTATRRWWSARVRETLLDLGVAGIWNDMNEPSNFVRPKTLPNDVLQGDAGGRRRHAEVHNLYGLRMCEATFDALAEARPGERAFILTRSGYAGIQRYAAVWTGDNRASWEHLLGSIPMCLGLGVSGVPFVGADIGGFDDDCTAELMVRWMQLGAFLPLFRNHCSLNRRAQEPWAFGQETEALLRDAIDLRYRFLPYLEEQFVLANKTGMPIARPLWLDFPSDSNTYDLADEFLFGPEVLVAPAFLPGMRARAVYLPPGAWVDFYDGSELTGAAWVLAPAPLGRIPLYLRAGAVIRMLPPGKQTAAWEENEIVLLKSTATSASRR